MSLEKSKKIFLVYKLIFQTWILWLGEDLATVRHLSEVFDTIFDQKVKYGHIGTFNK